jgi:hypothetical protein
MTRRTIYGMGALCFFAAVSPAAADEVLFPSSVAPL